MPEYLVTMNITFPPEMPQDAIDYLLAAEAETCRPYLESGEFARAWRTYGDHHGSHGHMALWNVAGSPGHDGARTVQRAYDSFPLVRHGYAENLRIQPLYENPNDPQTRAARADVGKWGAYPARPLTWELLWPLFGNETREQHNGELCVVQPIAPDVTIHCHPQSGNPRVIHFMVGDLKVADLGPTTPAPAGVHEDNVPGFVDFLGEWDGQPVAHDEWKRQIAADNGLVHSSYAAAKAAPRRRRAVPDHF
jgi:muconolactone delta-isomerase